MAKSIEFTFKQLGFDGKPLGVSLPPLTKIVKHEPLKPLCRCFVLEEDEINRNLK